MRVSRAQFGILISFMEEHGDLMKPSLTGPYGRIYAMRKWNELVDLLNVKSVGDEKSISRWKKCWSDLKNNTKKKQQKIKRNEYTAKLSEFEKRILKLMDKTRGKKALSESDDDKSVLFTMEVDANPTGKIKSSPSLRYFAEVDGDASRKSMSPESFLASNNSSSKIPGKRNRPHQDNIKVMTDRYLEFEREREKMAHEREMARIKQNDQLVTIFGRFVNVLDTIAPSIKRYLDRNSNGHG